jgi:hypothetical protein
MILRWRRQLRGRWRNPWLDVTKGKFATRSVTACDPWAEFPIRRKYIDCRVTSLRNQYRIATQQDGDLSYLGFRELGREGKQGTDKVVLEDGATRESDV